MWALRRVANPTRNHAPRAALARACFGNPGAASLRDDSEPGEVCYQTVCPAAGRHFPAKSFPDAFSVSSMPSITLGRNFSSRTLGDDDDQFSETEFEAEIGGEVEDDELVSAGEDEAEGDSLGLPSAQPNQNGEKGTRSWAETAAASPLFKLVTDVPWQSIKEALDKWVEEGNDVGRDEARVVLHSLRRRRFFGKALQFVEWLEENKRFDFEERDYASHLDLVAKIHGLYKAEKYIDELPVSFRGEIIYRTLLANYVVSTSVKKAEELFKKMKDLGFPITTFSCNQLLLLYKRVDRNKIPDVLTVMEKENVKPSDFTYRLLIDAKGRANDISGMELILETMKTDGVEPDLFLQSIVAKHYIYSGFKEKAEEVLKEMEGDNIKESRVACRMLLPLYASLGRTDEVERVWKVCEADPHLDECLAAIEAWGKLGCIDDAEEVFETMVSKWDRLSAKYYNALLKVYANHKLLTKGKDLAKRMTDSGCTVGPLTWNTLVKIYTEAGEVEKADSMLQAATQKSRFRPLYTTYMALLDKYSKRGDIHNSEKIFLKLKQIGFAGRLHQYHVLLQAYINAKVSAYGFRERLKADNIFPNKSLEAQLSAIDPFKKTPISELLD